MMRLLKERILGGGKSGSTALTLGPLELELMQILWSRGESNVRDVVGNLDRSLAYTTVMTTLDRLYKKGFLERHMPDRAFVYSPRFSREEWDRQRAESVVAGWLAGSRPSRELLFSSFLDAVGEHDAKLLDELEKKIRTKRREMRRRERS
ncbi:MAG TPA: BlaI/MecI/CopY family transcriptional regulator [Candidatus Acidoferrum sp.]|nr:BlaI/MecI/CopY family transcriptional regulator [Candidatus Acidoferrum sp.]